MIQTDLRNIIDSIEINIPNDKIISAAYTISKRSFYNTYIENHVEITEKDFFISNIELKEFSKRILKKKKQISDLYPPLNYPEYNYKTNINNIPPFYSMSYNKNNINIQEI